MPWPVTAALRARVDTLLRAPAGHRDRRARGGGRAKGATAAWIDESFDRHGADQTQVRATDFSAHPHVRGFRTNGGLAAGLSLASDPAGSQALVYKTCRADGGCAVRVTTRGPGAPFRAVTALGSIDAAQTPALSVSPRGRVIVGWIDAGHPVAAVGLGGHRSFRSRPQPVPHHLRLRHLDSRWGPWGDRGLDPGHAEPKRRRGLRGRLSTRPGSSPPTEAQPRPSAAASTSWIGGAAVAPPAPWLGKSAAATYRGWPTGA